MAPEQALGQDAPLSLPLVPSLCGPLGGFPLLSSRSVCPLTPSPRLVHGPPSCQATSSHPHPASPPPRPGSAGGRGAQPRCLRGLRRHSVPLAGPVAQAEQEPPGPPGPQPARAVQHVPGKTAPPRGRGHTASGLSRSRPRSLGEAACLPRRAAPGEARQRKTQRPRGGASQGKQGLDSGLGGPAGPRAG